jgi:peptidyl-prolyl cis-trans isomerase D
MLQQMRKYARSWVASIFLGLLALSFGVWGIADIFRGTVDTTVATIGEAAISQSEFQDAYQNMLRSQSARLGTQITPEQARSMGLGHDTLERLISRTAVDIEVARLGLTATDDAVTQQIRGIPAFAGPSGSFDHATFLRVIQRNGYTEQSFIAAVRSDTARDQLLKATSDGMQIPPGYARAFFAYLNQRRAVHYVIVPPTAAGTIAPPSDAQLQAYVKAHADRFSTPEYREFSYVAVTPADVMGDIKVTDKQLKNEYALRRDQYHVPEKRDVEQITFPDEKTAQSAAARIASGTSFEDVAKVRGLKPSDIALGEVQKADLGTERGKAAFALALNGVSKPVKSTFGWVLMKVTKIVPGEDKTFDQVQDALRKEVMTKLALNKINEMVNALEDAMAGGDTLEEAAKKTGMKFVHVKSSDKAGMAQDGTKADVPANTNFMAQVFAADVGIAGDPFQTKDGSAYALKVDGDTPPKPKPLDQVRAQAQAEWLATRRKKALLDKAKALAAQATKDKSLAGIAKTLKTTVAQSPALERGRKSDLFPADLLNKIFAAAPGTAVFGQMEKGGSYIVARVTGILQPPPMSTDPQYSRFKDQISNQIGEDIPTSLALAARKRQGVHVNQKMVDQVTGSGS